ncbi:MAG: hypothetical protein JNJ83_08665 [Verrucomicrobiaceae bacterium]|nr:hypothetical protein [Verrucomicrobiaceae bacterium]
MKYETFTQYPPGSMDLPQRALLTVWDCLAAYRDDLVLVGGLAVRHLTKPPMEGMPGPVTLDVDFGISVGASSGMYGSIKDTLSAHGFRWAGNRFVRRFPEMELFVDLLTDDAKADTGTAIVDDGLPVGIVPGIDRARECSRWVAVSGMNLVGVEQHEQIRVAEVGPMLVLKLNAFGGPVGRKAPKDMHDILYLGMEYLDGHRAAVAGFQAEKEAGNRGVPHAIHALQNYFGSADALGPMSCAAFRLGEEHESAEFAEASQQIRQQCVTLAEALLA